VLAFGERNQRCARKRTVLEVKLKVSFLLKNLIDEFNFTTRLNLARFEKAPGRIGYTVERLKRHSQSGGAFESCLQRLVTRNEPMYCLSQRLRVERAFD